MIKFPLIWKFKNRVKVFRILAAVLSFLLIVAVPVLSQSDSEPNSSETNPPSSEPSRGVPNSDSEENLINPNPQSEIRQNSSASSNDNPFSPTVVQGTPRRSSPSDVAKTLTNLNQFQTLASILQLVDLNQELQQPGFLVLFAPTEKAFDKLSNSFYDQLILPENRDKLLQFIKNHLVMGEIPITELEAGQIKTLGGTKIQIKMNSETEEIQLNESNTSQRQFINTQNGLIVPIDRILVEPQI